MLCVLYNSVLVLFHIYNEHCSCTHFTCYVCCTTVYLYCSISVTNTAAVHILHVVCCTTVHLYTFYMLRVLYNSVLVLFHIYNEHCSCTHFTCYVCCTTVYLYCSISVTNTVAVHILHVVCAVQQCTCTVPYL
jgi:hypothetical protein